MYLARTVTGAFRAVKVVKRSDFELDKTFEREFEGIQRYEEIARGHVGLVDILHVGREEQSEFYYYVMELADDESGVAIDQIDPNNYRSKTLLTELRKQPVREVDETISLGSQMAEALAYLHRSGLTHRDVKPSNIIYRNGSPMLADIGLVAASGQRTFVGTEGYVPPEGPGTSSADLYGLGIVLYEMHTGKDRFDFPELPTNHQLSPTINRDQWRAMNTVICQAGSPDPRKRFSSGHKLAETLKSVRDSELIGKNNEPASLGSRWRSPWVYLASLGGVGLLVLGLTIFMLRQANNQDGTRGAIEPVVTSNEIDVPDMPVAITPQIIDTEIEEEPQDRPPVIQAEPVPQVVKSRVKIDSDPVGATVWIDGQEVGRTPLPYQELEAGTYELLFTKEGSINRLVTLQLSGSEIKNLREQLLTDYRPSPNQEEWKNSRDMNFYLTEEDRLVAPVIPFSLEAFQIANNLPVATARPVGANSANETAIKLRDAGQRWDFCRWMTAEDRKYGYLDENQYYSPVVVEDSRFYCLLETQFVHITYNTEPTVADIYLDGQLVGRSPEPIRMPRGPNQITISKDGYRSEIIAEFITGYESFEKSIVMQVDASVRFGQEWTNSQDMNMVPIDSLLVASFETRSRDFDQYITQAATPLLQTAYSQPGDHPVIGVSRLEAEAFCRWLTQKEQNESRIRSYHRYRLPTDEEWSRFAGLDQEIGEYPEQREQINIERFPWGEIWPPPPRTGNFADLATGGRYIIANYEDGFSRTAPCGSFEPLANGLYDLSGNCWEWVSDNYRPDDDTLGVARGGGWDSYRPGVLYTHYRNSLAISKGDQHCGFRYVLEDTR